MAYAHGVSHTRPIVARGRHLSDAANEMQALADEVKSQRAARMASESPKDAAHLDARPESACRWVAHCNLCGNESTTFICAGCAKYIEEHGL